jgi:hypothetical protein
VKKNPASLLSAIGIAFSIIIAPLELSYGKRGESCINSRDKGPLMSILRGVMDEAGISFVTAGYVDWYVALDKTSKEPVLFIYCTEKSIKRAEDGVVRLLEAERSTVGLVWRSEIRLIAGLMSTVFYVSDAPQEGDRLNKDSASSGIRWIPVQILTQCGNLLLRTCASERSSYNIFEVADVFHKRALAQGLDKWGLKGDN